MARALHLDERFGLHERAISASLKLLNDSNQQAPSIEAIAAEMQVDPQEVHSSFNNNVDILNAAAEQALIRLLDRATKAMIQIDQENYIGQFHALARAYLEWANEHPLHFQLIVDSRLIDVDHNPDLNRYKRSILQLMYQILERAQESGSLHPNENLSLLMETSCSFARSLARGVVASALDGKDSTQAAKAILSDYLIRTARGASNVDRISRV